MTNSEHYDKLETRDPEAREAALLAALPAQLHSALAAPAFATLLEGVQRHGEVGQREAVGEQRREIDTSVDEERQGVLGGVGIGAVADNLDLVEHGKESIVKIDETHFATGAAGQPLKRYRQFSHGITSFVNDELFETGTVASVYDVEIGTFSEDRL